MLLPGLIREINEKYSNFLLLKLCQTSLVGLNIWSLFENCYCSYPWLLSEQDQGVSTTCSAIKYEVHLWYCWITVSTKHQREIPNWWAVGANTARSKAQHNVYFRLRARYAQLALKVTLSSLKSKEAFDEIVNQKNKRNYSSRGGDLGDKGNRKKKG